MGEYITDIRAVIGKQTLVLAGVCIYIFNEDRQILMQHRTDNGLWSCPGGIVEIDEPVDRAAIREVAEETGLQLPRVSLIGVASGPGMRYTYPNGDDTSNVSIVFGALVPRNARVMSDGESHELRWMDIPVTGVALAPPSACIFQLHPPGEAFDSKLAF